MNELTIVKANADMKVTEFRYEHSNKEFSVEQFVKLENVKYNDPIQRGCVWSIEQKSDLIHTILSGLMMPPVIIEVIRGNKKVTRNVIDGKQRLTSIRDFHKNLFALTDIQPVLGWNEEGDIILIDLNGLTYEQLPKSFKEKIDAFIIRMIELEIEDEEMKRMIFRKLNHGKQLNPHQEIKSSMSYDLLKYVAEMCKSPVFSFLSEKAINNEEHGKLIQQSLRLLYTDGDTDLNSKTIKEFVESGSADNETLQIEMKNIFERIAKTVKLLDEKQAKKVMNKLKLQSLVLAARKANEQNMSNEEFAKWMVAFFIDEYKTHNFKEQASGSTASREKVKGRVEETLKHFGAYVEANKTIA